MSAATRLVVDSSIAVKWFSAEEGGHDEAMALLADHENGLVTLASLNFMRLEVFNVLVCRRLGPVTVLEMAEYLEAVGIELYDETAQLAAAAIGIACETGLSVYDAMFVALARELDADLITDDRQIIDSGACRIRPLA